MIFKEVTILVYLHNNFDSIEACLNSIISHSNQIPKKIIVIDDGSLDGSADLLQNYKQVKIIRHEFLGISKSINSQLLNIGDNDLIRINGNVVITTEDWLEQLQNTAYKNEETGIVGVRLLLADNRIESDGRNFVNGLGYNERHINLNAFKLNTECKPQIVEVDSVNSALSYYKNSVIKQTGLFDENYFPLYTEDDDYCISARKNDFAVVTNSCIQAFHFIAVKTPTDIPMGDDNNKFVAPFTDCSNFIQGEHVKYWKKKWLWDLQYPDLNFIRSLYGNTKICWNIGDKLKYISKDEFPSVDLCLVTWNNLPLLKRMLESLAASDYPPGKIKVYITDNGSSDGTIEYLKLLSTQFIFKVYPEFLPINSGVAYGLNLAILKGNGELVARLDDDIILPADWLKGLVKVMLTRPYCGMTGPKVLNDNQIHSIQCSDFMIFPSYSTHENEIDTGQADYYSKTAHLRGCCNLYRRDVFKNCGLFDIRFSPSQFDDPDHQVSVILRGYEIIYNGHVKIIHKLNSGNNNSYAGLSNMEGNKLKFFGKWGQNIYEILDKSIEFSVEGRRIDINKDISSLVYKAENSSYIIEDEFYRTAENMINLKRLKQTDFNYFIDLINSEAINLTKSGTLMQALSILHLALNIDPSRITTVLFLYIIYHRLGIVDKSSHFKSLLKILNKKNIDQLNVQSGFYRDNYFKKVVTQLNIKPEQYTLEEIIEKLIIENQFNLALFISLFLFEESAEKV